MAQIRSSSAELIAFFETGDVPTADNFNDFIRSTAVYDGSLPIISGSSVSTGSFYINSALQNSISGSSNNQLSQGTDWDILSGVKVSNSTLTLESYSTSSYRGLAGLQIRPTQ